MAQSAEFWARLTGPSAQRIWHNTETVTIGEHQIEFACITAWLFDEQEWWHRSKALNAALEQFPIAQVKIQRGGPVWIWSQYRISRHEASAEFVLFHGDYIFCSNPRCVSAHRHRYALYANEARIKGWAAYTLPSIWSSDEDSEIE